MKSILRIVIALCFSSALVSAFPTDTNSTSLASWQIKVFSNELCEGDALSTLSGTGTAACTPVKSGVAFRGESIATGCVVSVFADGACTPDSDVADMEASENEEPACIEPENPEGVGSYSVKCA
jgi:hypothetical protein